MPRHPNVIWEQLAADDLTASLVVDGHHLPPSTVKAMIRAKTPERVILVTDAVSAAGQPPGEYKLGGQEVRLDENGRVAVPGARIWPARRSRSIAPSGTPSDSPACRSSRRWPWLRPVPPPTSAFRQPAGSWRSGTRRPSRLRVVRVAG